MTASPTPRSKSPLAPRRAPQDDADPEHGSGKGAARQGVRSASPGQQATAPPAGDGRWPVAWLTVRAPRGAVPTAASVCVCGRDERAAGHPRVLALVADHNGHRTTCPLRHPTSERRTAA